jgi:hypothetical protein
MLISGQSCCVCGQVSFARDIILTGPASQWTRTWSIDSLSQLRYMLHVEELLHTVAYGAFSPCPDSECLISLDGVVVDGDGISCNLEVSGCGGAGKGV